MISPHVKEVCRIGQGEKCCKYLMVDATGFNCAKMKATLMAIIDKAWQKNKHVAQGDNCEGQERKILNT